MDVVFVAATADGCEARRLLGVIIVIESIFLLLFFMVLLIDAATPVLIAGTIVAVSSQYSEYVQLQLRLLLGRHQCTEL